MEGQRRAVVVIVNLVILVHDPVVAATYLGFLVAGVNKITRYVSVCTECLLATDFGLRSALWETTR